jgi:hypothetical protein
MIFFNAANTVVGSISTDAANTVYGTSSDRRLKENIKPSHRGLDVLAQIGVEDFNFRRDPSKTTVQGFIAQDLYKLYPEAVTEGGGDATRSPWAVDYGRLSPLLVKSVQELKADNDNLRKIVEEQGRQIDELKSMVKAAAQ